MVCRRKSPSATFFGVRFDDAAGEILREALEVTGQEGAVGEWAEKTQVEEVSIGFDGELRGSKPMTPVAVICRRVVRHVDTLASIPNTVSA